MKPLVFFHVMKCGGTSVRTAVLAGADSPFVLNGRAARDAAGGFLAISENWRFRGELLSYLLTVGDHDVIVGHFRYHDAHAQWLDRAHYITMLRPPAERFTSLYNYRRARPNAEIPADEPFERVLEDEAWQRAGSAYVSTFCGDPGLDPQSDEAIERAIANLRKFAVVGVLADVDRFGEAVSERIARPVVVPTVNVGPSTVEPSTCNPGNQAVLDEICQADQRVYDALTES